MHGCVFPVLVLVLAAALGFASASGEVAVTKNGRCIGGLHGDVSPNRHVMIGEKILKFRIEMSRRISHQLVTEIFGIYVEEFLGYTDIELVIREDNFNATESLQRLTKDTEGIEHVPPAMANLELWVPPESNLLSLETHEHFKEAGIIAPPGRFGWFIPANHSKFITDYYTIFTSPETAKIFSVTPEELKRLKLHAFNTYTNKYYCTEAYCSEGMHIPTRCQAEECAILLAEYPESTGFVVQHIELLKLYVQVIWVGPRMEKAIVTMEDFISDPEISRSYVLLTWTPSTIVYPEDSRFITVSFPPCETYSLSTGCKYDLNRLVKVMWIHLERAAKPIYDLIMGMHFTAKDYKDLLDLYKMRKRGEDVHAVACKWMQKNPRIINWSDVNDYQNDLYIGGIFPVTIAEYSGAGIVTAANMAIEAVNSNNTILRGYELKLLVANGQCRSDLVMKSFVDYFFFDQYKKLVGILGPACSDSVEPLAGVAGLYNTIVMSYSAEGSTFSDREKYPYFFRTIGENHQYTHVYLQLLKKLQWKQVASITQDGTKYGEYISHLQDLLSVNKISFVANRKFPAVREKDAMMKYLMEMKNARIIIADIYNGAARDAMCQAYHLGMTAEQSYVWFLPLWLTPRWYDTDFYNREYKENISCTTAQMLKAINGHLGLTFAHYGPDDAYMEQNITVGEWRKVYKETIRRYERKESIYAGYAYDAVWTFALALDKLMKMNSSFLANLHNENTVRQLVRNIEETDLNGVSGKVQFGHGSARLSVVHVVQWLDNKTHVVGTFQPNSSDPNGGTLHLNESLIKWLTPDGKRPDDGAEQCIVGWFATTLDVSCDKALIILNITAFISLCAVMLIIFLIVKRRYDKQVQLTQRYWKSLGIDVLNPSNVGSLDKWEIPRDRVVINRKLGEGAFGFVYGGEAYFNEKGWVAVAVKTLKVGSTTEEKLDFLSEAEVMKRFEHKNIVKLLGVCTKNEPVYTIMEFMLYGDLKTFLLGRRHLVNERTSSEESDEVSSKKLTGMALDVARALSYLAELKYVHRDVASRNCLVNGARVVKLGDFGMTRPMFENDYYKFNRKGMLPVRWMSPESLGLGIFTPSSDVWSFGVLLYEIITFGSFPFQGLSNNQVLEHVKNGHTLNIPDRVKPQLVGLIRSCWNQDAKRRPQASEIVEFLANNPRLLAPTLDVPLSSVRLESTGQLSMQIPEKIRKFSITLRNRSGNSITSVQRPPLWRIDSTDETPSMWSQTDSPVETLPRETAPWNRQDSAEFSDTPFIQADQAAHIWDNPTENRLWTDGVAEPLLSTIAEGSYSSKYVALHPTGNGGTDENYTSHDTTVQADSVL